MIRSETRLVIALLLALAGVGCGSGDSAASSAPTSPTPAPTRAILVQGGFDLAVNYHNGVWFSTVRVGTLDVTVDWTYTDSTIWVYVGLGSCTEVQIQAGECHFIAQSLTASPKPRVLTIPGLPAGQYTLLIYNGSARPESVAFTVGLTS